MALQQRGNPQSDSGDFLGKLPTAQNSTDAASLARTDTQMAPEVISGPRDTSGYKSHPGDPAGTGSQVAPSGPEGDTHA